jgi:beta-glucosidase
MVCSLNLDSSETQAKKAIVGYPVAWDWIADNIKRAQDYLLQNTTLGIPALVQTEGMYRTYVENGIKL